MSGDDADAAVQRRTCEECGSDLVPVQVAFEEGDFTDGLTGVPVVRDVCPNPECPRHDADVVDLGRDADAPAEDPAEDPRPGSLGGDNGGA